MPSSRKNPPLTPTSIAKRRAKQRKTTNENRRRASIKTGIPEKRAQQRHLKTGTVPGSGLVGLLNPNVPREGLQSPLRPKSQRKALVKHYQTINSRKR